MRRLPWLTFVMLVQPWLLGCTGGRADPEPPASPAPASSVYPSLPDPFSKDAAACEGVHDCINGHGDPVVFTRPQRLSGGELRVPPEAIAQRVQGTIIAKCLVTVEGVLKDCHLLKSLPHMDAAVLDYLQRGRYSPLTYNGEPRAMSYTFTLRINPPEKEAPAAPGP